jgi:hypothetical protein
LWQAQFAGPLFSYSYELLSPQPLGLAVEPWYAELFMELHGKRYHHRHTLTNYALFSVDTTHSFSAPKEMQKEN